MSIVNLKIIFVKKQKTRTPNSSRDATFIITEMAVLTLGETGYPFDDSRQIGNTS